MNHEDWPIEFRLLTLKSILRIHRFDRRASGKAPVYVAVDQADPFITYGRGRTLDMRDVSAVWHCFVARSAPDSIKAQARKSGGRYRVRNFESWLDQLIRITRRQLREMRYAS